ncbi:MAG: recombination mediator RecR [bacterium]|nr:recombination mediator RecR [bacterium]
MQANPLLGLIAQLKKLPGVGEKSAQRMAFFLLSLSEKEVAEFAREALETRRRIRYCERCFNISLAQECYVCLDSNREPGTLCVVADPKDIFAMERMGAFKGRYHVIGGLISPLDGIHPDVLRFSELRSRLVSEHISEVILAINPTVEGDTTALYLQQYLEGCGVSVTKLAHGLPMGGDIDYADELTLQKALIGRVRV